jgi:hypothetical protein
MEMTCFHQSQSWNKSPKRRPGSFPNSSASTKFSLRYRDIGMQRQREEGALAVHSMLIQLKIQQVGEYAPEAQAVGTGRQGNPV